MNKQNQRSVSGVCAKLSVMAVFAVLLLASACVTRDVSLPPLATWEESMAIALEHATAHEYAFIIDHMLAPECMEKLAVRYGKDTWKETFRQEKLEKLPYYYGWLKKRQFTTESNKTIVVGQYGCWAIFVNVNGRFLLGDFGQEITSM